MLFGMIYALLAYFLILSTFDWLPDVSVSVLSPSGSSALRIVRWGTGERLPPLMREPSGPVRV